MAERVSLQYDRLAFPQEFRHFLARKYWGSALSSYDTPSIKSLSPEHQFQLLAWWAACPIPEEVWNNYKNENNIPWIINRYDSTNAVTKHVIQHNAKLHPELYFSLTAHIARSSDEPVGKHEKGHVPNIHSLFASPLSTLPGYASSRIAILMAGTDIVDKIKSNRLVIDEIQKAVLLSQGDPNKFAAYLFRSAINIKVKPLDLAGHALDKGKLQEEGFLSMYKDLYAQIVETNPESAKELEQIYAEFNT